MNYYFTALKWGLLVFLLIVLYLFWVPATYKYNNQLVIKYVGKNNDTIFQESIDHIVVEFINSCDFETKDINTALLEDLISEEIYVKKAEVYLDVAGILKIYVYFREPFLRVLDGDEIYYLDRDGVFLPKSLNLNQDLLLVNGECAQGDLVLFELVDRIYSNEILNELIGGIICNQKGEYILSSKICDLNINIGSSSLLNNDKIDMIKLFYNFLSTYKDCNYCSTINIIYDKQVICIK